MTTVPINQKLEPDSVKTLLETKKFLIPIYQREYAWTSSEIETLLRDIRDARQQNIQKRGSNPSTITDYFLGTLVVNRLEMHGDILYEVVDGQQRLTTIFILLAIGQKLFDSPVNLARKLVFEARTHSQNDLEVLVRNGSESIDRLVTDNIRAAAKHIDAALISDRIPESSTVPTGSDTIFDADDFKYLLNHVKLLVHELPIGTDLNHYFEIMNTRGEQLEKHEILKAKLIALLHKKHEKCTSSDAEQTPEDERTLVKIWDACARLDKHIQSQFIPRERSKVFGDKWDAFPHQSADDLFNALRPSTSNDAENNSNSGDSSHVLLDYILQNTDEDTDHNSTEKTDDEGSYGAIIDFPNLLLHVLNIARGQEFSWKQPRVNDPVQIVLDDKHLLDTFDDAVKTSEPTFDEQSKAQWVRHFMFLLLRTRFHLDTYVIRSRRGLGNDDENWVIHTAHKQKQDLSQRNTFPSLDSAPDPTDNEDGRVLMLQSMFQVTDTRQQSKYFLFQILAWLDQQAEKQEVVTAHEFANFLERIAQDRLRTYELPAILHQGTRVPNFIFNFLDYILWLGSTHPKHPFSEQIPDEGLPEDFDSLAKNFSFRYRTSVEHFYPREPGAAQAHKRLQSEVVDHFGNLCIMSRSENSARNNLDPVSKLRQYLSHDQSLKYQIMASITKSRGQTWYIHEIRDHGDNMVEILQNIAGTYH